MLKLEGLVLIGSGDGAGCSTCTLYAGSSGISGCWITGADVLTSGGVISENLDGNGESIACAITTGSGRAYFFPKRFRKPTIVF